MSYFAVDIGSTNIYVAVEQTGKSGRAEPRALELEQAAADGISRIYRRAPGCWCWMWGGWQPVPPL